MQTTDLMPELKKYFYRPESDVTWSNILPSNFSLWIDIRSSTNNSLHGSCWTVKRSETLLKIKNVATSVNYNLTLHVLSLEDTAFWKIWQRYYTLKRRSMLKHMAHHTCSFCDPWESQKHLQNLIWDVSKRRTTIVSVSTLFLYHFQTGV